MFFILDYQLQRHFLGHINTTMTVSNLKACFIIISYYAALEPLTKLYCNEGVVFWWGIHYAWLVPHCYNTLEAVAFDFAVMNRIGTPPSCTNLQRATVLEWLILGLRARERGMENSPLWTYRGLSRLLNIGMIPFSCLSLLSEKPGFLQQIPKPLLLSLAVH